MLSPVEFEMANYMQARYYDPVIGRFLSIDPVTFLDTGNPAMFNRYAYTFNDPINMIDPDGRQGTPYSIIRASSANEHQRRTDPAAYAADTKKAAAIVIGTASVTPIGKGGQIVGTVVKQGATKIVAKGAAKRRLGNVLGKIKDKTGATAKDIGDAAGIGTGPLKEGAKATTAQIGKLKDLGLSKKDVKAIAKGYKDAQKRGTGGDVAGGRAKYFKDIAKQWGK